MKANRVTFAAANVYISDVPPKDFIQPVGLEHPHVSSIPLDTLSLPGKRPRCLQAPASRGKRPVNWSAPLHYTEVFDRFQLALSRLTVTVP